MKQWFFFISIFFVLFILSGCSNQQAEVAYLTDGSSVQEHNVSKEIWTGVVEYAQEKGISHRAIEPRGTDSKQILSDLEKVIQQGAVVVIADGYAKDAVLESAKKHPEVRYLVVDSEVSQDISNVSALLFSTQQSGFLAGYGAVKEGATHLAFLSQNKTPSAVQYGYGFVQGAEYAAQQLGLPDQSIQIEYQYQQDERFIDTLVEGWFQKGVEQLFVVGDSATKKAVQQAEKYEKGLIGAEIDRSSLSPVVTMSAINHYKNTVYRALDAIYYEELLPGNQIQNATNNGIALVLQNTRLKQFTRKDYERMFALLAKDDAGVASSLERPIAADTSIASSGILLSKVTIHEGFSKT